MEETEAAYFILLERSTAMRGQRDTERDGGKYLWGGALVGVLGDPSFGISGSVVAVVRVAAGDWLLIIIVIIHILRVFIAVIQGLLIDILQHPKYLQVCRVTICCMSWPILSQNDDYKENWHWVFITGITENCICSKLLHCYCNDNLDP